MDIVSDGLLRLLGRQNLHIAYNRATPPDYIRGELYKQFRQPNTFDFFDGDAIVISTRSQKTLITDWLRRTSKSKRIAVLDGEDDMTIRNDFRSIAAVYFKRELTRLRDNIKPLPFGAFPEEYQEGVERNRPVSFRGIMRTDLRRQISEYLARRQFQEDLKILPKEAYNRSLLASRVGVSAAGAGWDTYRYWEVAYFGCALLSQRLPILIPDNLIDGVEVVFFDTIEDFKVKLDRLLSDGDGTRRLGSAARSACLSRHLSINRAKVVLENVLS
jgi:hypothetical protein